MDDESRLTPEAASAEAVPARIPTKESEVQSTWTRDDVERLWEQGFHLFPTGDNKLPHGKWRNGGIDYVTVKPTPQEVTQWAKRNPPGWCILCGGPQRVVCLDIEVEGLLDTTEKGERIREVMRRFPKTALRPTPSGGMHAWAVITDDDAPAGTALGRVVRDNGEWKEVGPTKRRVRDTTLLSEVRGHGQYALILGHGRDQLPEDWTPHPMTRSEWDEWIAYLNEVSDVIPSAKARKKIAEEGRTREVREVEARDWGAKPPTDTADVLASAVVEGKLSWLDVLEEGWEEVGSTTDGWTLWLRPSYDGEPVMSGSSANGAEIRGHASLTVHSSSVTWAESDTSYSPAEVLWRSGRIEAKNFAEAMTKVEQAAALHAAGKEVPEPFNEWDGLVLDVVHKMRKESSVLHQGAHATFPLGQQMAKERFDGSFRFVPGLGWLEWDGHRWAECPLDKVIHAAAKWAEKWIIGLITSGADPRVVSSALRYRDVGTVGQLVASARTSPLVLTDAAALDTDHHLLNTPTGIVDLRTGELTPNDPRRLMTKVTDVGCVPGARHKDWDQALTALDEEGRAFLKLRFGQALYGDPSPSEDLLLMDGAGENGKTALIGTCLRVVGDYGVLVSDRLILGNPDQHPTELMSLRGARLAFLDETPEARHLDVTRIKKTIGQDSITARLIRQDSVTFRASHSLFVASNYRPIVKETDWGTWRRLSRLPFPLKFLKPWQTPVLPNERVGDPTIKDRLRRGVAQRQAALAWMIEGAVAFHAMGGVFPEPPASMERAKLEWREESDLVLAFAEDMLVPEMGWCITATDAGQGYREYAQERGHHNVTERTFTSRFKDHDWASRHRIQRVKVTPATQDPPLKVSPRWEIRGAVDEHKQAWLWTNVRFLRPGETKTDAETPVEAAPIPAPPAPPPPPPPPPPPNPVSVPVVRIESPKEAS